MISFKLGKIASKISYYERLLLCGDKSVQKSVAGIFNQIQHKFKVVGTAVIGVGYYPILRMVAKVFRKITDFLSLLRIVCLMDDVCVILLIHDEDEVKVIEVCMGVK